MDNDNIEVRPYPDDPVEAVLECDKRLMALEAEKDAAGKKISAELRALKSKTGINIGVFKSARADAAIEDDGIREGKLKDYTFCFNALSGEGEQLSLSLPEREEATSEAA